MIASLIEVLSGKSPYIGKLGLDNTLFIFAGGLYLVLYAIDMRQRHWQYSRLHLYQGISHIVFGFAWDLYRIESLRSVLLMEGLNYLPYRLGVLLFALGPVIVELVSSIKALLHTPK